MTNKKLEIHNNIIKDINYRTLKAILNVLKEKHGAAPVTFLHQFDVLYKGWECDPNGWVVEVNNERLIILTDHGSPYVAKRSELNTQLKTYKKVIEDTEKAIKIKKEGDVV